MKPAPGLLAAFTALALVACKKAPAPVVAPSQPEPTAAVSADIPVLPVSDGDTWIYNVRLEIPADAVSPGSEAINSTYEITRRYIGKLSPGAGLPEVDCFELSAPDYPPTRELVEIHEDRILLRGSMMKDDSGWKVFWQDPPIPFLIAGVQGGIKFPELSSNNREIVRNIQFIAREDVAVPAGNFPAIRMLMTGLDGEIEFRRTIWFAPRIGIVREEKSRFGKEKLLTREIHEMMSAPKKQPAVDR